MMMIKKRGSDPLLFCEKRPKINYLIICNLALDIFHCLWFIISTIIYFCVPGFACDPLTIRSADAANINRLPYIEKRGGSYMSTQGEAYIAEKMVETQRAAERAARVKEFIADSSPEIISDLFAIIRDTMLARESDELLTIAKYYHSTAAILSDIETEFCRV